MVLLEDLTMDDAEPISDSGSDNESSEDEPTLIYIRDTKDMPEEVNTSDFCNASLTMKGCMNKFLTMLVDQLSSNSVTNTLHAILNKFSVTLETIFRQQRCRYQFHFSRWALHNSN